MEHAPTVIDTATKSLLEKIHVKYQKQLWLSQVLIKPAYSHLCAYKTPIQPGKVLVMKLVTLFGTPPILTFNLT